VLIVLASVAARIPDFRPPDLQAKGLGMVMITYDSPAILADVARRRGITFPLLSDADSRIIREFGIPFPGTFVVDRRAIVKARFFEEAYQERTTVASIMQALGSGARPATAQRVTTNHLELTAYATDEVVAPGSLFSIVLDVQPKAGMHVYAPGAKDYRIIAFNLEANPLIASRPVSYPASEIYFFEPLNERVPVFQKPFRLTQTVAISTASQHRATVSRLETLSIKGTVDYQACDDRICYTPASIPVSLTIKVRPLDGERSTVRP
jgi:hypothetical protein